MPCRPRLGKAASDNSPSRTMIIRLLILSVLASFGKLNGMLKNGAGCHKTREGKRMKVILLEFLVCRPVFSLPPWHGARWTAWLRTAARESGLCLEDCLLALKPLRNGPEPLRQGEKIELLLTLAAGWEKILPSLLTSLDSLRATGTFSAENLALASVKSWPDGRPLWFAGQKMLFPCGEFSEASLALKLEKLLGLKKWTLVFDGPLRLPLPPGHVERGRERHQFARPEFLASREGLAHLLRKVRFQPEEVSPDCSGLEPDLAVSSLAWGDMRYNPQKKMALGGVVGKITWTGAPDYETGRRLLAGEYCGAGKNGRFGLGFWHIAEILP